MLEPIQTAYKGSHTVELAAQQGFGPLILLVEVCQVLSGSQDFT